MTLQELIDNSNNIVVFSGAGISVPSGIPDFRSANGLYSEKYGNLKPEEIISHSFFIKNPEDFFKFYFSKMVYNDAKPNIAHEYFAKIKATIVTQNIDNLHRLAGSNDVYELHGSVMCNYCMKCHKFYSLNDIKQNGVPRCSCGGIIKPDVVLYEEELDNIVINKAISAIKRADLLIVVGTSLTVYPAASFIQYYQGFNIVLINKEKTPYDSIATMVFHEDITDVIKSLK